MLGNHLKGTKSLVNAKWKQKKKKDNTERKDRHCKKYTQMSLRYPVRIWK